MPTITTTRRGFMQLSATSAAALSLGATFASLSGCSKVPVAQGFKVLRPADLEFLSALAPVILHDSYPGTQGAAAEQNLLLSLDRVINTLQEYAKSQLIMLLDVMQYAPVRLAMGAPVSGWKNLSPEQVENFLENWKHSSIQLKRMGYGSLVKLFSICWYSQPDNFSFSHYPGMPKRVLTRQ